MVGGSNKAQRRACSRARRLQVKRYAQDRAFVEKLRRTEREAQRHALSIRDVDVELLHRSRRQKFAEKTEAHSRKCQAGIARRFWPSVIRMAETNALWLPVILSKAKNL